MKKIGKIKTASIGASYKNFTINIENITAANSLIFT